MISVKNLGFSYTKKPYIQNTSFEVHLGEILGFSVPRARAKAHCKKY